MLGSRSSPPNRRAWVSIAQLRSAGMKPDAILTRVSSGHLHRIHHGVFAVGHPGISLHGRFWAAVLACGPHAFLSHFAAAVLWGILTPGTRVVDVTVVGRSGRDRPGLRIHRPRSLHEHDRDRQYGIPVTSPTRTLLDLASRTLSDKALRRAVRQAQALHLTNVRQIAAVLAADHARAGDPPSAPARPAARRRGRALH
jgi:hypothetical protein